MLVHEDGGPIGCGVGTFVEGSETLRVVRGFCDLRDIAGGLLRDVFAEGPTSDIILLTNQDVGILANCRQRKRTSVVIHSYFWQFPKQLSR